MQVHQPRPLSNPSPGPWETLRCDDCGELVFDPRQLRCSSCWSTRLIPLHATRSSVKQTLLVWIGMICFWLVLVGWLFSRG